MIKKYLSNADSDSDSYFPLGSVNLKRLLSILLGSFSIIINFGGDSDPDYA